MLNEITDGVYSLSNLLSNQYLIVDENGLTLIDTGVAGNDQAILREIAVLGMNGNGLKRILITHVDSDHYGALNKLQTATDAETCATIEEANAIQNGRASRELNPRTVIEKAGVRTLAPVLMRARPARVDRILSPGEHLPVGGGLIVIDSAGHTPGHTSYYLPEKRILFSGDSIFYKKGRYIPSYGINCWDEERARLSMIDQLKLAPKIICGGHGIFHLE